MNLVNLLIAVVILGIVFYLVGVLPIAYPFKTAAQVLVALIALIYFLGLLGIGPGLRLK